jgi:hypothetical protein
MMNFSNFAIAQNNSESKKEKSQVQKIVDLNAKFIVALIDDGRGGAWIGTEDEGIFHYNTNGKIDQYTVNNTSKNNKSKDNKSNKNLKKISNLINLRNRENNSSNNFDNNGLGDNNGYALAIDKLGRLWVGHLNTGVSVFNGKDWKNYDIVDGPIGERIFDIKICPKDGDVWIATSAGISRYKINSDNWEHLTREDGLPEDQASAIAFKDDGTLIVGTQCHGIAIFYRNAKGEYKLAKNIAAPNRFGQDNISPIPLVPTGKGLPSNLINDILVTKNNPDGKNFIWIATSTGLVKMSNDFSKLEFTRGKDYVDKVKGLYGGTPKNFIPASKKILNQLLPEDYVTSLAEDKRGTIWIGTRQKGFVIVEPQTGKNLFDESQKITLPDNFVTKILPLNNGNSLIGFYGGGIVKLLEQKYPATDANQYVEKITSTNLFHRLIKSKSNRKLTKSCKLTERITERKFYKTDLTERKIISVAQKDFPKLPSPIKSPTSAELKLIQTKLNELQKPLPRVYAAYHSEDWKTQGDWVGRNNRVFAILCGLRIFDSNIFISDNIFRVNSFTGHNPDLSDNRRLWLHWKKTDNPKVLWDVYSGYRSQGEWNDNGAAFPLNLDGPDLWYALDIKSDGVFNVGMYFYNKDGHQGHNRFRDYTIEIYKSPREWGDDISYGENGTRQKFSALSDTITRETKPLARCRVRDFWGGVYKQFVVNGQSSYLVKIRRNYSLNAIVSAIMIDRLYGEPTRLEKHKAPSLQQTDYSPPPIPEFGDNEPIGRLIVEEWNRLDNKYNCDGNVELQRKRRVLLYRASEKYYKESSEKMSKLAYALKWRLNQWDKEQRKEWNEKIKQGWQNYYDSNKSLKKNPEPQKK